ncbi:hypothetical protein L1987_03340 [Smallanthus sonchifolius]|uniref:Uncharacterized protein n=1 Tax=Smallanthus sonchifolius TaxID=185202 RepID=A0ACB9KAH3_9ASTR|nr:hypothetical protein L1987_03340 [Smallanthus sonchifolius]
MHGLTSPFLLPTGYAPPLLPPSLVHMTGQMPSTSSHWRDHLLEESIPVALTESDILARVKNGTAKTTPFAFPF